MGHARLSSAALCGPSKLSQRTSLAFDSNARWLSRHSLAKEGMAAVIHAESTDRRRWSCTRRATTAWRPVISPSVALTSACSLVGPLIVVARPHDDGRAASGRWLCRRERWLSVRRAEQIQCGMSDHCLSLLGRDLWRRGVGAESGQRTRASSRPFH
jgi:hypothetical protein